MKQIKDIKYQLINEAGNVIDTIYTSTVSFSTAVNHLTLKHKKKITDGYKVKGYKLMEVETDSYTYGTRS